MISEAPIWAASNSIAEEIEGRTALTVLSKPLSRWQFILGKYAGIMWSTGVLFLVLSLVFLLCVTYKPVYDTGEGGYSPFYAGERMDGEVRLISPRIDPDTKLGRVRVSLAPHPQLRVGGYARVDFHRPFDPVPAVAEKALQWEANGPRLITIDDDNRARPVAVRVGTRDGDFISLVQGPPVGTRVALGSGVSLLEGDLVNPLEAQDASASAQVEPPP